jgi:hypothetical protein
MSINQQRICNVLTNNRRFVNIHIINVVYYVNTFALTTVCRLNNPHVLFALVLLQFLVVIVEIPKLFWQNVSVRGQIKSLFSKFFLHTRYVVAKSIFARDFIRVRKFVDLLKLIKALVLVRFERATWPQQVPLVALSLTEIVVLKDRFDHLVVKTNKLDEHFRVFNVVAFVLHSIL